MPILKTPVDFSKYQETWVGPGTERPPTGCGLTVMIAAIGEHFLIKPSETCLTLHSPVMINITTASFRFYRGSDSLDVPARMIRIILDLKDQTEHSMGVRHRNLISLKRSLIQLPTVARCPKVASERCHAFEKCWAHCIYSDSPLSTQNITGTMKRGKMWRYTMIPTRSLIHTRRVVHAYPVEDQNYTCLSSGCCLPNGRVRSILHQPESIRGNWRIRSLWCGIPAWGQWLCHLVQRWETDVDNVSICRWCVSYNSMFYCLLRNLQDPIPLRTSVKGLYRRNHYTSFSTWE